MDAVGCTPVFWKRFISNSSRDSNRPDCDEGQYGKLAKVFSPTRGFENGANLYINPCTEMTSVVTTTTSVMGNTLTSYQIVLKFEHTSEKYRETVNNEAFNSETLCSQVGGFIGM